MISDEQIEGTVAKIEESCEAVTVSNKAELIFANAYIVLLGLDTLGHEAEAQRFLEAVRPKARVDWEPGACPPEEAQQTRRRVTPEQDRRVHEALAAIIAGSGKRGCLGALPIVSGGVLLVGAGAV